MYDFQQSEFHKGGYTKSKGTDYSLRADLLESLSIEIKNLKREINSMEGKYISLLACYERLVKKNPNFLKIIP